MKKNILFLLIISSLIFNILFAKDNDTIDRFFNQNTNAMLLIDPNNGKIIKANDKASSFYGYSLNELQNMPISQINTLTKQQIQEEMRNVENIQNNLFIFSHKLKNGDIVRVSVHSFPILYNGKEMLFSIIHTADSYYTKEDFNNRLERQVQLQTIYIEQSKQTQMYIFIAIAIVLAIIIAVLISIIRQKNKLAQEKKFSTNFLEAVFDTQPNIALTTYGEKIHKANKSFLDFFEVSKLEEFTKDYDCICDRFIEKDGYLKKFYHNELWIDYVLNNPSQTHKVLLKKNDQLHEFVVNAEKLSFDSKHRRVVVLSDITQLAEQERIIFQQEKRAQMGDMIENITHQWKQPLSLISVSASGMKIQKQNGILDDHEFFTYCENIENSVTHLTNTIDDFKDFYKLGRVISNFFIDEAINEALSLYKSKFTNRNIEVILKTEPFQIQGYKSELLQVIMNILSNALDALEKIDTKRYILIETRKTAKNTIIISIKDNAGGISEDIIDKIFDSHFTTKPHDKGTGIGLYMSKKIIEEHFNGTLQVENSTFDINKESFTGALFTMEFNLVID
jgi:PAS domain S-box-containing protein